MATNTKPNLPKGWLVKVSKSFPGHVYYFNTENGSKTWNLGDLIPEADSSNAGLISPANCSLSELTALLEVQKRKLKEHEDQMSGKGVPSTQCSPPFSSTTTASWKTMGQICGSSISPVDFTPSSSNHPQGSMPISTTICPIPNSNLAIVNNMSLKYVADGVPIQPATPSSSMAEGCWGDQRGMGAGRKDIKKCWSRKTVFDLKCFVQLEHGQFRCTLCDKMYKCRSNTNKHIQSTHLNVCWVCRGCGDTRKSKQAMQGHLRKAHGNACGFEVGYSTK